VTVSIFQSLADAARRNESVALGIITGVKGSSPQKLGAKAIFHKDRRIEGTLGGGCLEAEAQRLALQALRDGVPKMFELVLDHDFGWDDGLICGGKVSGVIVPNAQCVGETFWAELAARKTPLVWGVTPDFEIAKFESRATPDAKGQSDAALSDWLYQEAITVPCALWIAGSGHVAQAIAPLALQLDFAVTIIDDRPELANHAFFPKEVSIRNGNWGEILSAPMERAPTFGLIATRGHNHDALVLESWIHRQFAFLGMLGSARKWRIISEQFLVGKIATADELARVACPVGVKIGSKSVTEIAVSIAAQLIEKRAGLRQPGA